MSTLKKSVTAALTVLALGTAALATSSAEAAPRHGGGRHGGWHGHHGGHGGHWGRPWRGHGWGRPIVVGGIYGGGYATSCRIVYRYNRFGELRPRRICVAPF
jgi:hypothetical protein